MEQFSIKRLFPSAVLWLNILLTFCRNLDMVQAENDFFFESKRIPGRQ